MASLTSMLNAVLSRQTGVFVGRVYRSGETQIVTVGGREVRVSGPETLATGQTVYLIKTPTGYEAQASSQAALTERRIQIDG